MADDLRREITNGEKYGPAMTITDQVEADAYFEKLVKHGMTGSVKSREEIEIFERENLGYYAGYYDSETRERVERLFKCEHPYLGSIAKNVIPSPEECFNKGFELGSKMKTEK